MSPIPIVLATLVGIVSAVYNVDPSFSRWPNPKQILYSVEPNYYTAAELQLIQDAATRVMLNMNSCVAFQNIPRSDTRYKIHITPYSNGVLQTFCFSYQGQWNVAINSGAIEQTMIITRGQYGCLDGSLRSIMRYFAIVLGKRNEHQRGDRIYYIGVNDPNLAVLNSYRLYQPTEAYWGVFPYDYCSITHNQPTDYSNWGTRAFDILTDPKAIPKLDQLSNPDCQLLSMIYGCPTSSCAPLDCTAARQTALTGGSGTTSGSGGTGTTTPFTGPTTPFTGVTTPFTGVTTPFTGTTTTMTSTTTGPQCPTNSYCTNAPDESSYLLGPYQLYQTLLLFTGPCVMEYKFDWSTGLLSPTQPPQLITTYFPGPGGPSAKPPLSLNYMSRPRNDGTMDLTMCSLTSADCLTCTENPGVEFNAASCPNPTNTVTLDPAATVSSVTSQINLDVNQMMQYVVLKNTNRTEIALMSADFSTTYQTSKGFLSGQSTIVAITAIQIIQDQDGINPQMMAVFGNGADGKGYVGYVSMPLAADPKVPIDPSDPSTFQWLLPPIPIGDAIENYC